MIAFVEALIAIANLILWALSKLLVPAFAPVAGLEPT